MGRRRRQAAADMAQGKLDNAVTSALQFASKNRNSFIRCLHLVVFFVSLNDPGNFVRSQAVFNAPAGSAPVALDMGSMGKGQVWVNGRHAGRYWSYRAGGGGCGRCGYAGAYREGRCLSGCGEPSQRWYHVPRSWLKPSGNLLVVLEEYGGDLAGVAMATRTA